MGRRRDTPEMQAAKGNPGKRLSKAEKALAAANLPSSCHRLQISRPPLMHFEVYCVDGATLRTGSANFSASGLKRRDNDRLILRGPRL